jgi:glycosyltransferase involved in cell wall biosynthesis
MYEALRRIYQYGGLHGLWLKLQRRFFWSYKRFVARERIPSQRTMATQLVTFTVRPLISIITPLYEPVLSELDAYFMALLEDNGYKDIELCLVSDGSNDVQVDALVERYVAKFPGKIKYQKNAENKGISAASNDALALASGTYVAFVDQDDVIAPHALFEYVRALQTKAYDFFYSDEDMLATDGQRVNPALKADWSPHTLLSRMYVNHLSMYKKGIVDAVGGLRSAFDGAQDYDLLLRASVHFDAVYHAPSVLYHWRASAASIASSPRNKQYIYERAERALQTYFSKQGLSTEVSRVKDYLIYDVAVIAPQAVLQTIVFLVQSEVVADVDRSWATLVDNLSRTQTYDVYVVDDQHIFQVTNIPSYLHVIKVKHISEALVALSEKGQAIGAQVLFFTSDVAFLTDNTLTRLLQLMQLKGVDVLAPSVVNQDMVITEAGRIIIADDTLAFSSYGVPFGTNDYFGNNISLVNYTFVSPACFFIKRALLDKIQRADVAETMMEVLINLRAHEYFYCVNVGSECVVNLQDSFTQVYRRPNKEKIAVRERFYNQNLSRRDGFLYKPKN